MVINILYSAAIISQGNKSNNCGTHPTSGKNDRTILIVIWNKNGRRCVQVDLIQKRWEISYIIHGYLPNTRSTADIHVYWIMNIHTLISCANTPTTKMKSKNKCSVVAEMGDHLATIDTGRKWGRGLCPFGGLGPHLTQCGLGQGLPSY